MTGTILGPGRSHSGNKFDMRQMTITTMLNTDASAWSGQSQRFAGGLRSLGSSSHQRDEACDIILSKRLDQEHSHVDATQHSHNLEREEANEPSNVRAVRVRYYDDHACCRRVWSGLTVRELINCPVSLDDTCAVVGRSWGDGRRPRRCGAPKGRRISTEEHSQFPWIFTGPEVDGGARNRLQVGVYVF